METAVNYILESSVSLGFLVLLYRAWFKHNPILWFNRLYLLLALAVSATIPLIHYTWGNPVATIQKLPEVQIGTGYYLLDAVTLWGSEAQTTFVDKLQQLPWLKLIYLTGILFLAAKLLIGLFRIR